MKQIRVAIVDDLKLIRETYKRLLDRVPEIEVVAEAESGQAGIKMVGQHRPDVVLMDSSMPGMDGYEATKAILSRFPTIKVIILTMWETQEHRDRSKEAGAAGFITKDANLQEITKIIKSTMTSPR